ncbi:MAG: phosphoribosylaminoimidazolesuccinocarboxamide synthase [Armatimonadetes bacterium]|jgi:phosphoribosylaminoimidazole-succinocarboxamide synthase|nr:phosphoribosylaminoimidazolesuccinocarboxamide synthase [Armatimonadota bacterium]MDI9600559.1 phosphoribosylaminoimidazolesuccinocarboxamide synthase [Acidobacteriota bacterium]
MSAMLTSELRAAPKIRSGKVRDVYDVGEALLIVATDRISAFDVIMPSPVPDKGRILHQMTLFWLEQLAGVCPNHLITAELDEFPEVVRKDPSAESLRGRSMLVKKAEVFPIECVARGYLTGSGWVEYGKSGEVCGHGLPSGLREADRLDPPIFTPSTKAAEGHDENISRERAAEIVGADTAARLEALTLELYRRGADIARERGIIIADTKFEFGLVDGEIILVDEVLTPDSSRFWPAESWRPGANPPSFDKQFVRDYLKTLDWDRTPPGPELPEDVVARTREKYLQALTQLTGRGLD